MVGEFRMLRNRPDAPVFPVYVDKGAFFNFAPE
jgi:hypothetical protein